jgi:hypothetical protein
MLQRHYLGVVRARWLSESFAYNHTIADDNRPNGRVGADMAQSLPGQRESTLHVVHRGLTLLKVPV